MRYFVFIWFAALFASLPVLGQPLEDVSRTSMTEGLFASRLGDFDFFGKAIDALGSFDDDPATRVFAIGSPGDNDGCTKEPVTGFVENCDRGAIWLMYVQADSVVRQQKISDLSGGFFGQFRDGDGFGSALAHQDLNGDGTLDLIVGVPFDDDGCSLADSNTGVVRDCNRGAVWILYLQADGTVQSEVKLSDGQEGFEDRLRDGDRFGSALAILGRTLFVGAPGRDADVADRGGVWVFDLDAPTFAPLFEISGGAGVFSDLPENAHLGGALTRVGRLRPADPYEYVAVSAPGLRESDDFLGRIWLLGIDQNGQLADPIEVVADSLAGLSQFGTALYRMDDLDGDQVPELAVGTLRNDNAGFFGSVDILFLEETGASKGKQATLGAPPATAREDNLSFGSAIAVDDLNGDGLLDELVIGAFQDDGDGELAKDRGAIWIGSLNTETQISVNRYTKLNGSTEQLEGQLSDGDDFGFSIANLGDLDGNGAVDLAVGAPGDRGDSFRGAVWILFMNRDGSIARRRKIDGPLCTPAGILDDDLFGKSVANIGDLNRDGVTDIMVGAPYDDDGGLNRGAVYVLFLDPNGQQTGCQKISDQEGGFFGVLHDGDDFGVAIEHLGDLDRDGTQEVAVGAPRDEGGAVWILSLDEEGMVRDQVKIGRQSGGFDGPIDSDADFGHAIAKVGDQNADGILKIAVGAPRQGNAGAVWLLNLDASGSVIEEARVENRALSSVLDRDDQFGASIAAIGDLDGNGVSDLAVGAAREDGNLFNAEDRDIQEEDEGALWLLFMNESGTVIDTMKVGEALNGFTAELRQGDLFGFSVESLGDLNGDGAPDLAVGAPRDNGVGSDQGALYIVSLGELQFSYREARKVSDISGGNVADIEVDDRFGASLAILNDLDGDGVRELAVGAPGDGQNGENSGAVWILFTDKRANTTRFVKIFEPLPPGNPQANVGHQFGISVTRPLGIEQVEAGNQPLCSDPRSDGSADLIVGAQNVDPAVRSDGFWILYLTDQGEMIEDCAFWIGADDIPFPTALKSGFMDNVFGASMTSLGDLDGDGFLSSFSTLVVGTPGDADGGAVWVLFLNAGVDGLGRREITVSKSVRIAAGSIFGLDVSPGDLFGASVANIRDIDGNGVNDLVVGAPGTNERNVIRGIQEQAGAAWILRMNADGTVRGAPRKIGSLPDSTGLDLKLDAGDFFGAGVGGVADTSAAFRNDHKVAIGAPGDDDGGADKGAIWVVTVDSAGTVIDVQKISENAGGFLAGLGLDSGDGFGGVVGDLVDTDEDGVLDLVIGPAVVRPTDGAPGRPAKAGWIWHIRFNEPPRIAMPLVPTADAMPDQPIQVIVTIDDNKEVIGQLNFRPSGSSDWLSAGMERERDPNDASQFIHHATIPSFAVGNQGIDYFVSALDGGGLSARLPQSEESFISIPMTIPEPGLRMNGQLPGTKKRSGYRLVSFPIQISDSSAASVLEDDLGRYDSRKWRFFEANTNTEFSENMMLGPGKAYWVLSRQSGRVIATGPGKTLPTDQPFTLTLGPGIWTYFGNPFNFSLSLDDLSLSSGDTPIVYTYSEGSWLAVDTTKTIDPFGGYIIWNGQGTTNTLTISARGAPPPRVIGGGAKPSGMRAKPNAESWAINIAARAGDVRDETNRAGVHESAARNWDRFDKPEPPRVWDYVSVYFVDENQTGWPLGNDIRPVFTEEETWQFEVVTNTREPVELTFEGLAQVPEPYEVWLQDDVLDHAQNLRETPSYTVVGGGPDSPRPLKLFIGNAGRFQDGLSDLPASFDLYQNFPNPFNGATTIKYALPEASEVIITIYNMLGQRIATLEQAQREAGYHNLIWDGRGHAGTPIASGAYFVRMQAGSFSKTNKMVVVN